MNIPDEDKDILYSGYAYLFLLNKKSPSFFTDMRLNAIFTSFICSRKWAWNVIGISNNAYLEFKNLEFKKRPKVRRGHLVQRIDTFRLLFDKVSTSSRQEPYPKSEFWEIFLPNDKTVLMTAEENGRKFIPDYYKISNDDYQLFTSDGIGFIYGKKEKEFLKNFDVEAAELISGNYP
jgi:hypothetical protein